jgi:hypothetical protein
VEYGSDHGVAQDVVGASRSLGQWTERAGPVLWAKRLDRVEFGMAAGNIRGACGKAVLNDVGSCCSGGVSSGTQAHGLGGRP